MKIEIWSDFVCPFCYIGKRKLEKALNAFEHKDKIQVIFKSFELNPDAPEIPVGQGYEAFAKLKNISYEQAKEMMDPVARIAKGYGLDYHMDKIYMVSTYKAHRLAKWARTKNKEKTLTENLMYAYFTLGLNISDQHVLLEIVKNMGLDTKEAIKVLDQNQFKDVVDEEIDEAKSLGIQGVPFFVFDRKYAISGAQPDEHFNQALKKAYQEAGPFERLEENEEYLCGPEGCVI